MKLLYLPPSHGKALRMKIRIVALSLSATLFLAATSVAQAPAPAADYVKEHYTKYEYRIPMRDGKKLFTSVYVPKDTSQQWPIMMDRTPYSVAPYGEDQYKRTL